MKFIKYILDVTFMSCFHRLNRFIWYFYCFYFIFQRYICCDIHKYFSVTSPAAGVAAAAAIDALTAVPQLWPLPETVRIRTAAAEQYRDGTGTVISCIIC